MFTNGKCKYYPTQCSNRKRYPNQCTYLLWKHQWNRHGKFWWRNRKYYIYMVRRKQYIRSNANCWNRNLFSNSNRYPWMFTNGKCNYNPTEYSNCKCNTNGCTCLRKY